MDGRPSRYGPSKPPEYDPHDTTDTAARQILANLRNVNPTPATNTLGQPGRERRTSGMSVDPRDTSNTPAKQIYAELLTPNATPATNTLGQPGRERRTSGMSVDPRAATNTPVGGSFESLLHPNAAAVYSPSNRTRGSYSFSSITADSLADPRRGSPSTTYLSNTSSPLADPGPSASPLAGMECRPDYTGGMERTLPQGHDARRPRPPAQTDHEWESVSLTSIGTSHGRCYSPATSVASPRPHPSRSALRNQYLAASDQQAPSYAPHMAQIATPSPQRPPHAYARRDLGVAPASNVGPLEGSGTLRNSSTPQSALHQNNQGYDLSAAPRRTTQSTAGRSTVSPDDERLLTSWINDTQDRLVKLERENAQLYKALEKQAKEVSDTVAATVQDVSGSRDISAIEYNRVVEQLSAVEKERRGLRLELTAKMARCAQLEALEDQYEAIKREHHLLQGRSQTIQTRKEELENEVVQLTMEEPIGGKFAQLTEWYQDLREADAAKESSIAQLEKENYELLSQIQDLKAAARDEQCLSRELYRGVLHDFTSSEAEVQRLQNDLTQAQNDLTQARASATSAVQSLDAAKDRYEHESDNFNNLLKTHKASLESLASIQAEKIRSENAYNTLSEDNKKVRKELKDSQAKLQSTTEDFQEATRKLNEELRQKKATLTSSETALTAMKQKLKEAEESCSQSKAELLSLESTVAQRKTIEDDLATANHTIHTYEDTIRDLSSKLEAAEQRYDTRSLHDDSGSGDQEASVSADPNEISQLKQEIATLTTKYNDLKESFDTLREEKMNYKIELANVHQWLKLESASVERWKRLCLRLRGPFYVVARIRGPYDQQADFAMETTRTFNCVTLKSRRPNARKSASVFNVDQLFIGTKKSKGDKDTTIDAKHTTVDPKYNDDALTEECAQHFRVATEALGAGEHVVVLMYGKTNTGKTTVSDSIWAKIIKTLYDQDQEDQQPELPHESSDDEQSHLAKLSCLEVQGKHAYDLLGSAGKTGKGHELDFARSSNMSGIVNPCKDLSLSTHLVSNSASLQKFLKLANGSRKSSPTKHNDSSSRSHAFFTLHLANGGSITIADLAGHEAQDPSTTADPKIAAEAKQINQELQHLNNALRTTYATFRPGFKQKPDRYKDWAHHSLLNRVIGGYMLCMPDPTKPSNLTFKAQVMVLATLSFGNVEAAIDSEKTLSDLMTIDAPGTSNSE